MSEFDYTGDKIKNYFTAYLQKCIRWKRKNYLQTKAKIDNMENSLEESKNVEYGMTVEEMWELYCKEKFLFKESKGEYPEWNKLADQKLVDSLLRLCEEERLLIYQHIFEGRTFKEIGYLNGLKADKVKNTYYYAIRKVRKWMGVIDNEI